MMKTKIVYCLVSSQKDYYYEQLLISLCSLRKYNPEADVYVVCDSRTAATLKGTRQGIFDYNITFVEADVPNDWNNRARSRYIKTHLRNIVSGDYLYIDTDTVICSSLDYVDSFSCVVGAVFDSHVLHRILKTPKHPTERWVCDNAQRVGRQIVALQHFNSGVFFVKDHPLAYSLYESWAALHKEFQIKGVFIDQLPLMLANKQLGEIIVPLPSEMNCQVIWDEGVRILGEAKIIHYFPFQNKSILSSPWLLDPVKETGKIPCTIQRIVDDPKSFFGQRSQFIYGREVDLIESDLHRNCVLLPRVYKFLLAEIRIYLSIKKVINKVFRR